MVEITLQIEAFAHFLTASWEDMLRLKALSGYTDSFTQDWLQANWELLVEIGISDILLMSYGEGADVYGTSERVTMPEQNPTHLVACMAVKDLGLVDVVTTGEVVVGDVGIPMTELVSFDGRNWHRRPPFEYVLCGDYVFSLGGARFVVRPILPEED